MFAVPALGYVLLFVSDPIKSDRFYNQILGLKPVEESPTFVLYVLNNDVKLGLWSRDTAEPKVDALPGATEICFEEKNIDVLYTDWVKQGIVMAQPPTDMDFGRTFVALDPDGHRIRIYTLHREQ